MIANVRREQQRRAAALAALDAIDPQDIVVSVGEDNKHDHPHEEMIEIYDSAVGADHVRQTCQDGTL